MTPSDREPTGQRIARAKRRRGLSQAVIAGLVGRSESWLSQVERGKRGVDSHSVLVRLAGVLRVESRSSPAPRTGMSRPPCLHSRAPDRAGHDGRRNPSPLDSGDEPGREASLDFLRAQARFAYQAYQATRYDAAGRILPGLIRRVETAVRTTGTASPTACAVRARVYDTAAALLSRVGEPFLDAYAMTRKDAAAVNLLLAAERLSPQLIRYDPATRHVLTELLRREHRPSTPELRPLARRAGVI